MINLFAFLLTFCIQFASIEYPYNVSAINEQNYTKVVQMLNVLSNNNESWIRGYAQVMLNNVDSLLVVRDGTQYDIFMPIELADSSYNSTFVVTGRDNEGHVSFGGSNLAAFIFNSDYSYNNVILFVSGTTINLSQEGSIVFTLLPFPYDGTDTFTTIDESEEHEFIGLGSFDGMGHTESGDPLDYIKNTSFSSINGTGVSSGHSVSINQSATLDYTNPVQNLLGQVVNNTNNIIGNTGKIFDGIKQINNNIVNGVTTLFNAISGLNNNLSYILEKPDAVVISQAFQESKGYQLMDNGSEVMLSAKTVLMYVANGVSSTQQQTLIIPIDFTDWSFRTEYGTITPFNQIYIMRFEYLEDTKTLWQPLFLALLYFSIATFIYFDIPNLFRGASNV